MLQERGSTGIERWKRQTGGGRDRGTERTNMYTHAALSASDYQRKGEEIPELRAEKININIKMIKKKEEGCYRSLTGTYMSVGCFENVKTGPKNVKWK